MYNLVQGYLSRLPASLREEEVTEEDGTVTKVKRCIYTPHSLWATTATLLLGGGKRDRRRKAGQRGGKRDRSDIVKLGRRKAGKRDRSDIVKLGGPADVRAIFTRARHFDWGEEAGRVRYC